MDNVASYPGHTPWVRGYGQCCMLVGHAGTGILDLESVVGSTVNGSHGIRFQLKPNHSG